MENLRIIKDQEHSQTYQVKNETEDKWNETNWS